MRSRISLWGAILRLSTGVLRKRRRTHWAPGSHQATKASRLVLVRLHRLVVLGCAKLDTPHLHAARHIHEAQDLIGVTPHLLHNGVGEGEGARQLLDVRLPPPWACIVWPFPHSLVSIPVWQNEPLLADVSQTL